MSPEISHTEQILMALNEALKAELTAVNQYLLNAKMCRNWGYSPLAEYYRKESMEELSHAEILIDRILSLQGVPEMADLLPIKVGESVKAQFENDLALETDAVARLNTAIRTAIDGGDNVTRQLFDKILVDEDQHVDHLESQLGIINKIGEDLYLAQQVSKSS